MNLAKLSLVVALYVGRKAMGDASNEDYGLTASATCGPRCSTTLDPHPPFRTGFVLAIRRRTNARSVDGAEVECRMEAFDATRRAVTTGSVCSQEL